MNYLKIENSKTSRKKEMFIFEKNDFVKEILEIELNKEIIIDNQ